MRVLILGGDGSVATNGFWSAITMATTLHLPILFFIEDNGYGISVGSEFQTPGANIANNLRSFKNLMIYDGDGTDPEEAAELIESSVSYVRKGKGPALIRLTVPRLNGHSYQDNQSYKEKEQIQSHCQHKSTKVRLETGTNTPKIYCDDCDKEIGYPSKEQIDDFLK